MSKKILTKEILQHRLIPIEDFNSMTPEAAELYAEKGQFSASDFKPDELGWLEELSPEVAVKLPTESYRGLNLDKLRQISVKVAQCLAKNEGEKLSLNGLCELSPELAEALSNYQGILELNGITSMDEKTAGALSSFAGQFLDLSGLSDLGEDTLIKLAACDSALGLGGLKNISEKAAKVLVGQESRELHLQGLIEISDETALILSRNSKNHLNEGVEKQIKDAEKKSVQSTAVIPESDLSKIRKLIKTEEGEKLALAAELLRSCNAAEADYARLFPKTVVYRLLSTWKPKVWDVLCEILCTQRKTHEILKEQIEKRVNNKSQNYDAQVELEENLSHLCEHCDGKALELLAELRTNTNWVSSLTNSDSHIALAKALVLNRNNNHEYSWLGLNGITELDEEPARELIKLEGELRFKCLDELSDQVAEILSTHKFGLHFSIPSIPSLGDGLVKLSDQAAESFSRHQGKLELQSLKELSDKGAEYLSKHPNLVINEFGDQQEIADCILSKRGPLTKEIVERFIEDDQSVRLDGYTSISEEAVDALGGYQDHLNLDGLTELSDESMEKLSNHKSWLSLRGLTQLTDAQAESLSKYGQGVSHLCILSLMGLKNLSDNAAQFLAKAKGRVDVAEELEEK